MNFISNYENHIIKILNKEKIEFEREKTFNDLHGGRYRYDFYLPRYNYCIECDGQQHFFQVKRFQKTRTDFLKQQEHDRIKNSYCLANNIRLYRIPYWEFDNINSFKDIIKEKYRVKNKWHNDVLKVPKK